MNENVAPVVIDQRGLYYCFRAKAIGSRTVFVRFREHAVCSCSISLVHNGRMSDEMKPPVLFTKTSVRNKAVM